MSASNRNVVIITLVALGILIAIGWLLWPKATTAPETTIGQQICPEAWYEDKMPGINGYTGERAVESRQYFIVDGKRVGLDELDINWVKTNCSVNSPEIIQ